MCPLYRQYKNTNYLVSCFGTVRHKVTFNLVKFFISEKGYKKVSLYVNGKKKNLYIHRLVGLTWVRKPHRKGNNIVNHKDANKLNNYWTNFEWTTISGNTKHAVENGLIDMNYVRSFRK